MSPPPPRLPLFAATGVELEYMIVDAATLDVRPVCDELIRAVTGEYSSDVERGRFCWSNELVLHVVELKTNGPAPSLRGLADGFQGEVDEVNRRLAALGARLMPTAMHPWMDPLRETRLWPHEYSPVYEAYDRIFSCRGHGWGNLQSLHLNLPFANDTEFAALHAAIRALLPLMPSLAASSPVMDARTTGWLDNRLETYRTNSARIPSLTGHVVPEAVFSQAQYEQEILQRLYRDIAPFDPDGILQDEFLNARGAIARFGRGSIEIRVLDVQECPQADLAVAQFIIATLRALAAGRWVSLDHLQALDTERLSHLLQATARLGEAAAVDDPDYRAAFGLKPTGPCLAGDVWQHLAAELPPGSLGDAATVRTVEFLLEHGPLARRILRRLDGSCSRDRLRLVYGQLCDCLATGQLFPG